MQPHPWMVNVVQSALVLQATSVGVGMQVRDESGMSSTNLYWPQKI
jgi:hypothetical protein